MLLVVGEDLNIERTRNGGLAVALSFFFDLDM